MLLLAHGLMECPLVADSGAGSTARGSGMAEPPSDNTAPFSPHPLQDPSNTEAEDVFLSQESVNGGNGNGEPGHEAEPSLGPGAGSTLGEGATAREPRPLVPHLGTAEGGSSNPGRMSSRGDSSAGESRTTARSPRIRLPPCHSVKASLRRRCPVCKIRTYWVCAGCQRWSMCPGTCFLEYHRSTHV